MSPAFICSYSIRRLVNNLFGVKLFNPVLVFYLSQGFKFTVSAIVSCDQNCADNNDDHDLGLDILLVGFIYLSLSV